MKYAITHKTQYTYSQAVPVSHNAVHLKPRSVGEQSCYDFRLVIQPEPNDISDQRDVYGNSSTYFSIEQAHLGLSVTAISHVTVRPKEPPKSNDAWEGIVRQLREERSDETLEVAEFACPSERVKPFQQLSDYARQSFPEGRPLLEAAIDLTHRIYTDFHYDPRATNVSTPITTVFKNRRGVCQDFAHLQLACFRSLGLAARYVSGYLRTIPPPGEERLVGADASHAWVSVYCGEAGWVDLDPTNDVIPAQDHITLAWGRDYNDVSPIRGVILGGGTYRMNVSVDVAPLDA